MTCPRAQGITVEHQDKNDYGGRETYHSQAVKNTFDKDRG
jgi:hypothetical protein